MQQEIIKLEEDLRQAMLASDVKKLDELIDDSLVFIGPDGSVASKQMDLDAHRSKIQKIQELNPTEQVINDFGSFVVVTVKMAISGTFGDFDISGMYRYLRVWENMNGNWRVITGSVTKIAG